MLDRLASPSQEWHPSIRFTYWLQYHLHRQLARASQFAASRHVALKGDLPIGEVEWGGEGASEGAAESRPSRHHSGLRSHCGSWAVAYAQSRAAPPLQAWTSAAWTPGCTPSSSAWTLPPVCVCVGGGGGLQRRALCQAVSRRVWLRFALASQHCLLSHRLPLPSGAPPDYFDPNGQNWGFPTYNWEEMAKDGCRWWRRRLAHMAA